MSAAEKLKRMLAPAGMLVTARDAAALYNALPEIIAVVKAAEAVAGPAAYRGGLTGRGAQARDALSALDEKLGDVT